MHSAGSQYMYAKHRQHRTQQLEHNVREGPRIKSGRLDKRLRDFFVAVELFDCLNLNFFSDIVTISVVLPSVLCRSTCLFLIFACELLMLTVVYFERLDGSVIVFHAGSYTELNMLADVWAVQTTTLS